MFLSSAATPLCSSRQRLSNVNCLEVRRAKSKPFCTVLCTTVVHNETHTQFLNLNVGFGLNFVLCVYLVLPFLCFCISVFLCCLLLLCYV